MKAVILSIFLAVALASYASPSSPSDDRVLASRVQHTWLYRETAPNGVVVEGKTTYISGGELKFAGRITENGTIHPINGRGTWRIKDGYLYCTVISSNVPKILPKGATTKDKIVRITETEFTSTDTSTR